MKKLFGFDGIENNRRVLEFASENRKKSIGCALRDVVFSALIILLSNICILSCMKRRYRYSTLPSW